MPPMICTSVLLPQPLGPRMQLTFCDGKRCVTRSSATTSFGGAPKTCTRSVTAISIRRPVRTPAVSGAAAHSSCDHRDALNLDHDGGLRKAAAGDRRARRKILAENLAAQLGHACRVAGVDQEHRHCDQIGELGAGFGERLFDVAKGLPALRVELAGEGTPVVRGLTGMAGDIDRLALAADNHSGEKGPRLLPRAAYERFSHAGLLPQDHGGASKAVKRAGCLRFLH